MPYALIIAAVSQVVEELEQRLEPIADSNTHDPEFLYIPTPNHHFLEYVQGIRDTAYKPYNNYFNGKNFMFGSPVMLINESDGTKRFYARVANFLKKRLYDSAGKRKVEEVYGKEGVPLNKD